VSAEGTPYREVRSLERGLALLDAMADLGWSTPSELARRTAIDRSTVYRLLATLVASGYAVRRPDDGRYFLAGKLGSIGLGIRSDDLALQIAQEELDGLVAEVGWPSDYAALVAGRLTILASTHRLTSMTFFRRLVGQHRPSAARRHVSQGTRPGARVGPRLGWRGCGGDGRPSGLGADAGEGPGARLRL
jgi:IclR family transcriptional regulator, mhp operon transcriptional activator